MAMDEFIAWHRYFAAHAIHAATPDQLADAASAAISVAEHAWREEIVRDERTQEAILDALGLTSPRAAG